MTVLHRRALAAAPLAALAMAACLGAAPALAKPVNPPALAPDICNSRYLIVCNQGPIPGTGDTGWHRRHRHNPPQARLPPPHPRFPYGRVPLPAPF